MRKTGKFTKKGTNEEKKEVSEVADGVEAGNDDEKPDKDFGGSEEESSTAEDKSTDAAANDVDNKKPTKKESNEKKRKIDDSSKPEAESEGDDNDEPLSKRSKRGAKKSKAALKAEKKAGRAAGKKAASPEKDEEYEVEKVIDMKEAKGKRKFLIRWKGYQASSDTWEDEEGLCCAEAIKVYMASVPPAAKKTKAGPSDAKAGKKKKGADENGEETTEEYEVESILEVYHKKNGTDEFLVRWKGYGKSEDTWEPEAHLSCPELITKFKAKVAKAKAATPRELRAVPPHTDRFTLSMSGSGRRLSRRKPGKQRTSYHEQE